MLTRMRIRDFRSITDLSIELNNLNIFVGRNDTGKSNILRALNLFFNGDTDFRKPLDFAQDFSRNSRTRQGKAPEIRIDLILEVPSGYKVPEGVKHIEWTKRWRREGPIADTPRFIVGVNKPVEIGARSKIHSYLSNIDYHYIPALKGKEFFSELLADIYDVLSDVSAEDLKDASSPLQDKVESILAAVADELQEILKDRSEPKLPANLRSVFRLIQFETKGIDLDRRGDGIRVRHIPSLVKFLCDLKATRSGRHKAFHLWGLEEPENSVDFVSAFEMRDQIRLISKDQQYRVLMATHSPIFFALEASEDALTNFFSKDRDQTVLSHGTGDISDEMGVLRVVSPYVEKSQVELKSMKETLVNLQGKLQGGVLDPSQRIIFMEGDTDVSVFSSVNNNLSVLKETKFVSSVGGGTSSASSVADYAVAWHFLQKNRPDDKRVRGVGLVDGDLAGDEAIERFLSRMQGENNFHSRIERLRPGREIATRYKKSGFNPKIRLEDLFPIEMWQKAKGDGWLVRKSNEQVLFYCDTEKRESVLSSGMSSISEDDPFVLPILYDIKISRKSDFSEIFLTMLSNDPNLAEPFRATLIEMRSVLNRNLL